MYQAHCGTVLRIDLCGDDLIKLKKKAINLAVKEKLSIKINIKIFVQNESVEVHSTCKLGTLTRELLAFLDNQKTYFSCHPVEDFRLVEVSQRGPKNII